jgi:hypothetical protein
MGLWKPKGKSPFRPDSPITGADVDKQSTQPQGKKATGMGDFLSWKGKMGE